MRLTYCFIAAMLVATAFGANARETANKPVEDAAPYSVDEVMALTQAAMTSRSSSVCSVAPDTTLCTRRMDSFNRQTFSNCSQYHGWDNSMPLVLLEKVIHAPTKTAGDKAFEEAAARIQMWREFPKTDGNCTTQQWNMLFKILNTSYETVASRVSAERTSEMIKKNGAEACANTRESQLYQAAATYLMSKETKLIAMGTVKKERDNLDTMGVNNLRNQQDAAQSVGRARWMAEQSLAAYKQLGGNASDVERWAKQDPCK